MKLFSNLLKYLLGTALLAGAVSCSDDNTETPPPAPEKTRLTVNVSKITFSSAEFSVRYEGEAPTVYAYEVVTKGTERTAEEVSKEGKTVTVRDEAYPITGLANDTDYTIYAVGMGESGLSELTSADFRTLPDDGAPKSEKALGIRLNEVTANSMNFTLQRGSQVVKGLMAVWPTVQLENLIEDAIRETPEITRDELIAGWLLMGYGMEVDGTEENADWRAAPIWPDADYTVMMMGILEGEADGDVSTATFHSGALDLVGNPGITLTLEKKDYMKAWIRYTITPDSYGYMRFITDKSEIDSYLERHTMDDLREFTRFSDNLFEQLFQRRIDLEDADEQGNPFKIQSQNFGWEAGEHWFSAMAVACDENYSVPKEVALLHFQLDKMPENTKPAEFTCEARNIAANNFDLHFEFEENCLRAYANVLPADSYRQVIDAAGGDLNYARQLWEAGWVMYRENESDPTSPLANQDDMFMGDYVHPGQECVIVATALNYSGVLNSEITVSEPFTMKEYTYENSQAPIEVSVDKITKTSARAIYRGTPQTRILYNVTVEADYEITKLSDDEIRQYIMEYGQEWPYFHEKDEDWNPEVKGVTWTWNEQKPGKTYVVYACGQDTEGRISGISKASYTTLAANPGPNPDVELKAYNITSTSCTIDLLMNADAKEMVYALVEDNMLNYDPNSDSEAVLEEELVTVLLSSGMPAYDSVIGSQATSLPYGGTFYLAAIAYGSNGPDGQPYEKLQYLKVQLKTGGKAPEAPLSARTAALFRKVAGGDERAFEAVRRANMEATDRSPVTPEGKLYVRDAEDAQNVLEQMGGYRSMRTRLEDMKQF